MSTAAKQLFIGGAYRAGAGTEAFDVISPTTGEHVATVPVPVLAHCHCSQGP